MNRRRLAAALAAGVLASSVPALADDDGSGRLVEIAEGRKLYIECRGTGSPTVVLQSGYRNNAAVSSAHEPGRPPILPRIARLTRVCAYDRPGTLWAPDPLQPQRSGSPAADRTRDR
jgi:hypothetical protein